MKKLTRYFFEGLIYLVPAVVSIYIVYIIFIKIDNIFMFKIPGIGFAVTILAITLIGFIASNFLTRGFVNWADGLFSRVPLVKMIYTSVKDLTGAFVGEKKPFKKPVLVAPTPGSSIRLIGFVTKETLEGIGLKDSVAVYLPQSFNYAGNLIIVPRESITPINAEGGDIMAFIVSGGMTAK
jgi:uncharacterized membrane protein